MRNTAVKLTAIAIFTFSAIFTLGFKSTLPAGAAPATFEDPAAAFKAKCAMCHTPTASKYYDPAVAEEEQIKAILEGTTAKDPNAVIKKMPGFAAKGVTADDAKALAAYMKSLKTAN